MTAALAGWPYATREARVGGHTMAYVDEGSGPPVVLVHGNPTWSFYYRRLIEALPPLGLRAIAPDHIGMGRSDKPSASAYPHTLARRVQDFGQFVDGLGLDGPLSLVVHDWGGAIALAWAVDHVDRVDKLLVLNTGAFPLPPGKGMPWSLTASRLSVVGDVLVRRLNAFSLGALVLGSGRHWLGPEARAGLLAPYDSPEHRVSVAEFVRDIPLSPDDPAYAVLARTESRLHLLADVPTVVCWGMKDPVFDATVLDHLLTFLPQAEVHRYADAGHYVLEDVPERIVPLATRLFAPRVTERPSATTLDGLLAEQARAHPDRVALVLPRGTGFGTITYARLDARVDAVAAGLRHIGIGSGTRTALLVPPTVDFFVLGYALQRVRAVPVLVDPGIGRDKVLGCLAEAAPEAFVGVAKAHLARRVLGWAASARVLVTVGPVPVPGTTGLRRVEEAGRWRQPFVPPERPEGSPAAILFTSGSTGPPKGVEHGDAQLLAQARLIAELYDMGPGEVSLSTFPPFALFGPALGMTTVVPRMDATRPASVKPARVVGAANRYGATVMFGSPALLDTVSRGGGSMPTLRRVISAGAPVPRAVQRRTLAMLGPDAQVHTPYGATEALPVATIGSTELLALPEAGICVGRPVPGVDVALVRVTDEPLTALTDDLLVADGEVGEVVVRGPVVSPRYADRPDATAAAKLDWDGQVAHRTGDLASRDADGRLWFAGRKAHVVHTAAGPLYSVPCEEVFNLHQAVRRSALVGTGPRGAQVPALVVQLEPGVAATDALTAELRALGAADARTRTVERVLYRDDLPVDIRHNSKIDRPALAVWVQEQS